MAGLWEHWQSEDGSEIETCAIITSPANELMAPIHERMPVILPQEFIGTWLDLNARLDDVADLLHPCESEMLVAYPVSNLVNNPKFDSPSCIARV
jgi:putative SOS response-associated peptidase YedK